MQQVARCSRNHHSLLRQQPHRRAFLAVHKLLNNLHNSVAQASLVLHNLHRNQQLVQSLAAKAHSVMLQALLAAASSVEAVALRQLRHSDLRAFSVELQHSRILLEALDSQDSVRRLQPAPSLVSKLQLSVPAQHSVVKPRLEVQNQTSSVKLHQVHRTIFSSNSARSKAETYSETWHRTSNNKPNHPRKPAEDSLAAHSQVGAKIFECFLFRSECNCTSHHFRNIFQIC